MVYFHFLTCFFPTVFHSLAQLLEACVKNCGKPLHQELGKFRFLNELIRMISPKVHVVCVTFEVDVFRFALLYVRVSSALPTSFVNVSTV